MKHPPHLLAVVALPWLLASCGDLDVTRAAKPCTIVRYAIGSGSFTVRVNEHADAVLNNIKIGADDGGFLRLGEAAYIRKDAHVLAIEGCQV